ncbi:MAG: hypothetical protein K0U54_04050 [Bacteroidetes bacterium]|nr:hypothetical protein [Bacteroidota bacterium]
MNINVLKYSIIFLFIVGCKSNDTNTSKNNSCELARKGQFTYGGSVMTITIFRNDSIQTDKVVSNASGNTYYLKSKIDWLNSCEYNLTLISSSAKYKYPPGTVLNVKVDDIQGKKLFYTKTIDGKSKKGEMRKIK